MPFTIEEGKESVRAESALYVLFIWSSWCLMIHGELRWVWHSGSGLHWKWTWAGMGGKNEMRQQTCKTPWADKQESARVQVMWKILTMPFSPSPLTTFSSSCTEKESETKRHCDYTWPDLHTDEHRASREYSELITHKSMYIGLCLYLF